MAALTGFADPAHMSATFRKCENITPREFRISGAKMTLLDAVKSGALRHVEAIASQSKQLDSKEDDNYTPLMLAALNGQTEIVRFPLSLGANPDAATKWGTTALTRAAQDGQIGVVGALLDHGASVNMEEYDGYTALSRAAMNGHYAVAELLLENGADPGIQTRHGHTALTPAKENHHTGVASLL